MQTGESMRIVKFLTAAVLALFGVIGLSHLEAADATKPNILLIVADDLGWGELGFQGNKDLPTPQLDSLAQNGVRLTSGYVSGPYCSPTRAALLTGRYQQRFGHEFNPGRQEGAEKIGLSLQERTIADRLKAAGYATGMFGKWHLGNAPEFHPLKRGFDEYYGFLGGAHTYLNVGAGPNAILRGTEPVAEIDHTTESFARESVKFIEKNKDKPWFVYLPFNAVHGPLEAPEKYLAKYATIEDPKRRAYAAMQHALDDAVGVVLAKLRELKLEENTLIVFFTDNGGPTAVNTSSNGPLRGFKASVWEGGVRVPFVVQWKGHLPAGKTFDHPAIQIDVQPTVLAAAGIEARPEDKFDGVNLLPYLTGEKKDAPHQALFWRFGPQRAVRSGDWKLVEAGDGVQLFNLKDDISEKTDVATKNPEKLKELEAAYVAWNKDNVEPKWVPGDPARFLKKNAQKSK
jgi:arylsulfatase A-like enzyme